MYICVGMCGDTQEYIGMGSDGQGCVGRCRVYGCVWTRVDGY